MDRLSFALVGARVGEVELKSIRVQERVRQHGIHLRHRHEFEGLPNLLWNLIEVRRVALRKNHALDPRTVRSEHLLFDAADGKHAATQSDLTCHCDVVTYVNPREQRNDRRHHGDTGARPVFRHCACRDVDVDVALLEEVLGNPKRLGPCANVAHRRLGGLLHHVTELAGELELARAVHLGAFDEEDFTTDGRPGEASRDAGFCRTLRYLRDEARRPEVRPQRLLVGDGPWPLLTFSDLHRDTTNDACDLTLEITNAGFTGVVIDDRLDGRVLEGDLLGLDAMLIQLLRHEMHARDVELFAPCVTGDLDDLHAVPKRRRDGVAHIARGYEHHLREVVWDFEVVVAESVVLLGVEHLEQRCRRVATEVVPNLVDLVEHEDRVDGAGLLHALDDLAW